MGEFGDCQNVAVAGGVLPTVVTGFSYLWFLETNKQRATGAKGGS